MDDITAVVWPGLEASDMMCHADNDETVLLVSLPGCGRDVVG